MPAPPARTVRAMHAPGATISAATSMSSTPVQSGPPAAPPTKRTPAELINIMEARMAAAVASALDISAFINRSKQERVASTLTQLGLPAPATMSQARQPSGSLTVGAAGTTPGELSDKAPSTASAADGAASTATRGAVTAANGPAPSFASTDLAASACPPIVKAEPGVINAAAVMQQALSAADLTRTLGQDRQLTAAQQVFHISARPIGKKRRSARSDRAVSVTVQRTVAAEVAAAATELASLGVDVDVSEEFGLPVVVATALNAPVPAPRVRVRVSRDYPRGGASYSLEYLPSPLGKDLVRMVDARLLQCCTQQPGAGVGVAATLKAWAISTQAWADAQVAVPAVGAAPAAVDAAAA